MGPSNHEAIWGPVCLPYPVNPYNMAAAAEPFFPPGTDSSVERNTGRPFTGCSRPGRLSRSAILALLSNASMWFKEADAGRT